MKKITLILTLVIILFGCNRQSNQNFSFTPNGKSSIKIEIKNCDIQQHYSLLINNVLPWYQIYEGIEIDRDTVLHYQLNLHYPVYGNLSTKKENAEFFLIPNDTLNVILDFGKGQFLKDIIRFKGETSSISKYLTQYRKHWNSAPSKEESAITYDSRIDEFYSKQLDILDSIADTKTIANKYIDIERANIQLEKEHCKSMQYSQRYAFHRQFISERNPIVLSSMEYYWLQNATELLCEFKHEKYDTLLHPPHITDEIFLQFCQDNIDSLKNNLNSNALSFFIAHRATVLLDEKSLFRMSSEEFKSRTDQANLFIEKNASLISDSILYKFIINKRDSVYRAYALRNSLNNGDIAPNFFLESLYGKTISLEEYKGKLVLLNFWGTYCAPCIRSIPKKNELVNLFDKEQFVLINICTDYEKQSWKKIISDEEFQGEHLICKGQWNKTLCSKYDIFGIPHYTLINQVGEIIKNNIHRDSIETYIQENL